MGTGVPVADASSPTFVDPGKCPLDVASLHCGCNRMLSPVCYPTILPEGGLGNPLSKGIWHLLFKVIFKVAMTLLALPHPSHILAEYHSSTNQQNVPEKWKYL